MTFQVNPISEQEHILIQITDTHLLEQPSSEFVGMQPERSFHQVMQHIQNHYAHTDMIIHTGDLAQEAKPTTYQRYLQYMQKFGVPFFHTPGNHDNQQHFPFHTPHPQDPLRIELGHWQIILLNSAVTDRIDGFISTHQQQQLYKLLQEHPDQPTILACHHHPLNLQSEWIDQHKLKNSQDLFDLLKDFKQVKAVLYGHVHQNNSHFWQHIECLSTPSTCVQFKPKSQHFALDAIAPGYRVLKLKHNGEFESIVHRLDHFELPADLQTPGY